MLQTLKHSRVTGAVLAAIGVSWGSLAAVVPDLKAQAGLDEAQLGFAILFAAAGSFASMYASPFVVPRIGRFALPLLGLLLAAAMFLPGAAQSLLGLGIPLFVFGLSVGMLDMGANMRIADVEAETGQPLMNFNHGLFSLFFALSALWSGSLRSHGASPSDVFLVASGVIAALIILSIERGHGINSAQKPQLTNHSTPIPWGAIVLTAVVFFAAFLSENAIESWTALYFESELGAGVGKGALGPFTFGLIMAAGRFGGQAAVSRVGPLRLLLFAGVMGAIGVALLASAPSQTVALLAIAIAALGLSIVVPNANTVLVKFAAKGQRGYVLARAWMIGFAGFFVGPSMVGFIANVSSLRIAFGVVACLILLIVPAALILGRRLRAAG